MLLLIHIKHRNFHDVADGDNLAGCFYKPVAYLRNVNQTVLMNADIDEKPKSITFLTVPVSTMPGLRSFISSTSGPQKHGRRLVARVAAGLYKLGSDVVRRQRADSAEPRGLSSPAALSRAGASLRLPAATSMSVYPHSSSRRSAAS